MLLAIALGLLALISFLTILASGDDEAHQADDPRDALPLWTRFGHH
jgi:hypothetical protein